MYMTRSKRLVFTHSHVPSRGVGVEFGHWFLRLLRTQGTLSDHSSHNTGRMRKSHRHPAIVIFPDYWVKLERKFWAKWPELERQRRYTDLVSVLVGRSGATYCFTQWRWQCSSVMRTPCPVDRTGIWPNLVVSVLRFAGGTNTVAEFRRTARDQVAGLTLDGKSANWTLVSQSGSSGGSPP